MMAPRLPLPVSSRGIGDRKNEGVSRHFDKSILPPRCDGCFLPQPETLVTQLHSKPLLPGAAFFTRRSNRRIARRAAMAILPLFTQHSRSWRDNRYVYPVISRRSKGLSIGVNLNPDKVCNFDCIYCCVDRTVPATIREVDLEMLGDELKHMLELVTSGELFQQAPFDATPVHLRRLNDIAFSGDGEPTSFPKFEDACELSASLLQQAGLEQSVKLVVITNATLFHQP